MQFAVLYEARANTGIDRMKIINSVAKSVPAPHKVDLSNPDKTIVVEIVKVKKSSFCAKLECGYLHEVFHHFIFVSLVSDWVHNIGSF